MSSSRYRFVLEQRAFEQFVGLRDSEGDLLASFFVWLADRPFDTSDYQVTDDDGRINCGHLCGPFVIVAWTDHAVREVRIVQIIRN
jgi:hypothetical protein